jgi:hypothetical protein
MNAEEIMEIMRGLDPGTVAAAGVSYGAAAAALETLAERIAMHIRSLAEHWDGTAADTALTALRQSRARALTAAAEAKRTGAALTWLGEEILPLFRALPDPAGQPDAGAVASRYLAALDAYLLVAAEVLPLSATAWTVAVRPRRDVDDDDLRLRNGRIRPSAIRAQNDQANVAENLVGS